MKRLQSKDGLAGLLMTVWGAYFAFHAYSAYSLGSFSRMGPGMYPFALGLLLAAIGVAILVKALVTDTERAEADFRSAGFVLGGLAAGALTLGFLGVAPALFLAVFIASVGTGRMTLPQIALFSALVTATLIVLFVHLLNINLVIFRLPSLPS